MIVTIKTLQQQTFKIEVQEADTVATLKSKIELEKGSSYAASSLKLIYAGKILNDSSPLSDYNIQESNFIVVMVSKVKPTSDIPQTHSQSTANSSTSSQPPVTSNREEEQVDSISESVDQPSTSEAENIVHQAESTLCTGSDYEEAVTNLMSLGYDRNAVVDALRHTFNNPDRAASYLADKSSETVTEEPENIQQPQMMPSDQPTQPSPPSQEQSQEHDNPLSFLRQLPQFQGLQESLQRDPRLLPALLQEIGNTNPELLQIISQNQEAFMQLLNEQRPNDSRDIASRGTGPAQIAIQVTPSDKAAIDRLKALGFDESLVIQAYFACDKNEELAANFLLNSD